MTERNNITPKAQQVDTYVAREGRATRQMVASEFDVSGPRANELLDKLLERGRITRVARGIYEHQYYSHPSADLDQLRQFDDDAEPHNTDNSQ
ncbi:FeoC-like transcriptional regulator [Natronorubrum halalkaliphilum]|uniref:FeoC-like transcriptional regulator n=1 Tax=Natronorubrum halalkaliphilum TaxID=2691917 RepID=UPI003CCBAA2E